MKKSRIATLGALAVLVGVLYAPGAFAQAPEWTTWSVNEPTRVGEKVLEPGTYRLVVVRTPTSRNFVRVMSSEGTELFTTALTVPHVLEPGEVMPEGAQFTFFPAMDGEPRVLRTWWAFAPPGGVGHDFVYDEDYATRLARVSSAPVVSYRGTIAEADLDDTELHIVTPEARVETYTFPETRVTTVETTPVRVAEVRTERSELPQTAGETPLYAVLGLLSIAGALVFRAIR